MGDGQPSDIARIIRDRRTVRKFTGEPLPQPLIVELLDIANWAPNHGLREPWRYIQYKGEARSAFADAVLGTMSAEERERYGAERVRYYTEEIPVHLIIVMTEDPRQKQWDENFAAVCCWIQNFQLAAWEKGIGVVWKTNTYMYAPSFRQAAGVRPGEKIVGVLHVGYPASVQEGRPRTAAEHRLTVHG